MEGPRGGGGSNANKEVVGRRRGSGSSAGSARPPGQQAKIKLVDCGLEDARKSSITMYFFIRLCLETYVERVGIHVTGSYTSYNFFIRSSESCFMIKCAPWFAAS